MSDATRVKVLVVDDSAFARKVLREVLSADPRIEVVGIARDGLDALERIDTLKPEVVTLDLVMPELDGVGVLRALRERGDTTTKVIAVTMSDAESALGIEALEAGALDIVHKPTALATDRLYDLRDEIVGKVVAVASARRLREGVAVASPPPPPLARGAERYGIVAIGASTGGPQAISEILRGLPSALPVPVAIVLHMPIGYTEAYATRLRNELQRDLREATEGAALGPGVTLVGRAGEHLRVAMENGAPRARLSIAPMTLHRPSVDELFTSVAVAYGPRALGVILTGMGNDGLEGARALRTAGGRMIAQSGETCVVDGMPRCVREAGLANDVLPLSAIADAILRVL